jgi:hypothetical protein
MDWDCHHFSNSYFDDDDDDLEEEPQDDVTDIVDAVHLVDANLQSEHLEWYHRVIRDTPHQGFWII